MLWTIDDKILFCTWCTSLILCKNSYNFISTVVKDATVFCIVDNNGTLIIHDSNIKRDVGSYKCTATNRAGTSKDIATLDKPGKSNYLWLIWYLSDMKKLEACQATRTFQSGF